MVNARNATTGASFPNMADVVKVVASTKNRRGRLGCECGRNLSDGLGILTEMRRVYICSELSGPRRWCALEGLCTYVPSRPIPDEEGVWMGYCLGSTHGEVGDPVRKPRLSVPG